MKNSESRFALREEGVDKAVGDGAMGPGSGC